MKRMFFAKLTASLSAFALLVGTASVLPQASASGSITLADMPSEYEYAAEWIWTNRITYEDSTGSSSKRYNLIFDQIIAGDGTLNYVVRWQSYKTLTLEQRQQFAELVEESINAWTDWLVDYEDWPYDHVEVNIVGWAVLDESCLLDLQDDEVVYTDTEYYDSQYDTGNGYEEIPSLLPNAPAELWRFNHFTDTSYVYPGTRFDMYLWATQGWPDIGGCGGDWGQRLSDNAYLNMLDGENLHVLIHEIGHGFGMTDFYGEEGESDGYPIGGFPGDGTSIMMAGSSTEITDFDGWMLRYMWSQISQESGRFDLSSASTATTTTTMTTTTTTTKTTTTTTTIDSTSVTTTATSATTSSDSSTTTTSRTKPGDNSTTTTATSTSTSVTYSFTDTITAIVDGSISFAEYGTFTFAGNYYNDDPSLNLENYEVGDIVTISFTASNEGVITSIVGITIETNIRDTDVADTLLGDVNLDDTVTVTDIVALTKYLLGESTLTSNAYIQADMNEDSLVNVYDLTLLKKTVLLGA